jgi:hypothetical protein
LSKIEPVSANILALVTSRRIPKSAFPALFDLALTIAAVSLSLIPIAACQQPGISWKSAVAFVEADAWGRCTVYACPPWLYLALGGAAISIEEVPIIATCGPCVNTISANLGADVWMGEIATTTRPSSIDRAVGRTSIILNQVAIITLLVRFV